ncbi:MAG: DNA mismatch repair endonuclease MutL [Ktedonobacterales bacterium]|nr:DNA mismatch repair endonuclease MutL [Ktedonobacterales bacterium]
MTRQYSAEHSAARGERPRIAPLAPEVVERIAAGEVIERPASVVRELIENALDAGATSIRIELREGGLRLIRVADDGVGIAAEELELACRSHATSKVRSLADLERVGTLGFRGEALASMAAVAELELTSADDERGLARRVTCGGAGITAAASVARPRGTTVAVRALFHGMPARRALLRGRRAEDARCGLVVRAYALAHPAVCFTLVGDGALLLRTPGSDLPGAVEAIYGGDIAHALLPLGLVALEGGTLRGYVAARAFHYPSRDAVHIAVNGRLVANRALVAGAEAGYRPLLRKGRHPLLIVWLDVEPDRLDANVHPAKAVVLLRDERAAAAALRGSIAGALGTAPASLRAAALPPGRAYYSRPLQLRLPAPRRRRGLWGAGRRPAVGTLGPEHDERVGAGALPRLEALAQFEEMLILARSPEGHLFLVDQHRAHERVLYERLLRQRAPLERIGTNALVTAAADTATGAAFPGQLLLEPLVVELAPAQAAALVPRLEELRGLGLECQPFGGSVFLVRTLPHLPGAAWNLGASAEALVRDAAEDVEDWLDQLCIALACRSAVRRGQALAPAEQRALLADLAAVGAPALCPHGSPLLLRYTHGALARAFEW